MYLFLVVLLLRDYGVSNLPWPLFSPFPPFCDIIPIVTIIILNFCFQSGKQQEIQSTLKNSETSGYDAIGFHHIDWLRLILVLLLISFKTYFYCTAIMLKYCIHSYNFFSVLR